MPIDPRLPARPAVFEDLERARLRRITRHRQMPALPCCGAERAFAGVTRNGSILAPRLRFKDIDVAKRRNWLRVDTGRCPDPIRLKHSLRKHPIPSIPRAVRDRHFQPIFNPRANPKDLAKRRIDPLHAIGLA